MFVPIYFRKINQKSSLKAPAPGPPELSQVYNFQPPAATDAHIRVHTRTHTHAHTHTHMHTHRASVRNPEFALAGF